MLRDELIKAIKALERNQRQLNNKVDKELRDAQSLAFNRLNEALQVLNKQFDDLTRVVTEAVKGNDMALEAIKAQVDKLDTVGASVVSLLGSIKAKLDELASQDRIDPAEVQAVADKLGSEVQGLADAVTANTPASDEPTPAPTPAEEPAPVE